MIRQLSDRTLATLVADARAFGERVAIIAGGRALNYLELDDRVGRFAAALVAAGVAPGDIVSLHAPTGWEWVVAYHAAMRMGAVVNPLNALLAPDEVRYILTDCGARLLIADRARIDRLGAFGLPTFALEEVEALSDDGQPLDPATVAPDDLSTVCYTSGTTGRPKGAMLTHRNVLMNAGLTGLMQRRVGDDVTLTPLPLAHVYGNVVMNATLLAGGTLVLLPAFDPTEVLDAIAAYGATRFDGVPTMYFRLLDHPGLEDADLSSLRMCTVGGQTMPEEMMRAVEARFGCTLVELWGMSEIAGVGTTFPATGPRALGSIGVPLPLVSVRVVDRATGAELSGEPGELQVRGPIVMRGYLGDAEATRTVLDADGWLSTGDVARIDAAGQVWIVDRAKDVILVSGNNVYPAEIERVVAEHPAVAMVAVGRDAHSHKGETPHAYVVLRTGASADAESIVAYCRARLAPYKLPRAVSFLDDLPRNSTGKILRRALPRP